MRQELWLNRTVERGEMLSQSGSGLLVNAQASSREDHPLSADYCYIFNVFADNLHIWAVSRSTVL